MHAPRNDPGLDVGRKVPKCMSQFYDKELYMVKLHVTPFIQFIAGVCMIFGIPKAPVGPQRRRSESAPVGTI